MNDKSKTCFGKNKKPLSEFYSESDAQEGAEYANNEYKQNLVPYRCQKCHWWHLSPEGRQTPSSKCSHCTDRNGVSKDLYVTKKDAERRAELSYRERDIRLDVYECEYSSGWHLTKRDDI